MIIGAGKIIVRVDYTRDKKRDKEVLRLREKEKLLFKEIGERLNISKVRARQLYVRLVKEREKRKEAA